MNISPKYHRAARNGKTSSVSLDAPALLRLAYCKRFAADMLVTKATASTIVRRALILYEAHCLALAGGTIGNPEDAPMYRDFEAAQLRAANRGRYAPHLSVEDIESAPSLRPIGELLEEKEKNRPRLIDRLAAETEWMETRERMEEERAGV